MVPQVEPRCKGVFDLLGYFPPAGASGFLCNRLALGSRELRGASFPAFTRSQFAQGLSMRILCGRFDLLSFSRCDIKNILGELIGFFWWSVR